MKEVPLAPEESRNAYNILWSEYRHFQRLLLSIDKTYYKLLVVFLVVSAWFIYMQGRGGMANYRIGILSTGIGLLICYANLFRLGLMYEKNFSCCISKMKTIKEKKLGTSHADIDNTRPALLAKILLRFLPILLAYACTVAAAVSLSSDHGYKSAPSIGMITFLALLAGMTFYYRKVHRWYFNSTK